MYCNSLVGKAVRNWRKLKEEKCGLRSRKVENVTLVGDEGCRR